MSKILEDTNGCDNQSRCALDIYLMTVLLYLYDIIMDRAMNAPGHVNNVVDGINAIATHYLKGKMELIGKSGSKNTTNIGMLTIASKDVSIKCLDQFLHILNNR